MSSFLSPKYLRTLRGPAPEPPLPIEGDRSCAGCGYNLRGLKTNGRCPECGLHIETSIAPRPAIDLIGGDDPAMRRRMQWGFFAASLGLAGMVATRLWMIVPFPRPENWITVDIPALMFALAWCAGIWLITPKALDAYGPAMRVARHAARALSIAWPCAMIALLVSDIGKPAAAAELADYAWRIARGLGGFGVLVVLYMLVLPAYDALRDDISKWLITSFWGLLFLSPFIGMIPRGIAPVDAGWVFYGFLAVFIAVWAILAGIAVACLWTLSRTAAWKSGHLRAHGTRDERIRETRAEIDREVRDRIRPFGPAGP